ncbi:MAG TPA: hypothetical protein VE035_18735 [Puia sp.]|nr:hypothetical protein [Puia sp.]
MILSQIGLVIGMIGAFLLYKYPVATKMEDPDAFNIESPNSPYEKKKIVHNNSLIESGSNWGLGLIFISFLLQLLGTFKIF